MPCTALVHRTPHINVCVCVCFNLNSLINYSSEFNRNRMTSCNIHPYSVWYLVYAVLNIVYMALLKSQMNWTLFNLIPKGNYEINDNSNEWGLKKVGKNSFCVLNCWCNWWWWYRIHNCILLTRSEWNESKKNVFFSFCLSLTAR